VCFAVLRQSLDLNTANRGLSSWRVHPFWVLPALPALAGGRSGQGVSSIKPETYLFSVLTGASRFILGCPAGEMGCIENVRGVGYRLIIPGE
jgi:hypothetical protein